MVTKKDLVIAVLITFCLTSSLFLVQLTRSQTLGQYDPWLDINDDGKILIEDVAWVAKAFGTKGDPINKTALLLELQARVDSLNASNIELQSQVDNLNASLQTLEAYVDTNITDLEARIAALEAPGSVTTDKIADGAVTSSKLASDAIPFAYKYFDGSIDGSPTSGWENIGPPLMSVTITLQRTSNLIITFSSIPYIFGTNYWIYVRALVDGNLPWAYQIFTNPIDQRHSIGTRTCNFVYASLSPGTHTIQMQWYENQDPNSGQIDLSRTLLTVTGLPA